jgi:hypothetical protein
LIIIGIDPGLSGAIAMISEDGRIHGRVMPVLQATKTKKMVDEHEVCHILEHRRAAVKHVFIEKVQAMKGQGVSSCFNFGCGWGILRGVCVGLHLPYTLVHPQTWKKVMCKGLPNTRDDSIIVAKRIWPGIMLKASPRSKKEHDGIADALCIAEYGRRCLKGG